MDINGKKLVNIPHAVSNLITNDERQDQAISELEETVRQALVGIFHYKGSVATYADLPVNDNQVGDVYNVLESGKNYAWSGTEWDDLAGIVDLSNYVTLDSNQTITGTKTFSSKIQFGDSNNSIGQNNGELELKAANAVRIYKSIVPSMSDKYVLGNSFLKIKSIYLSSGVGAGVYFAPTAYIQFDPNNGIEIRSAGNRTRFRSNVCPTTEETGVYNLGDSYATWKDLYLSGKVNPNASGYGLAFPDTSNLSADDILISARSSATLYGSYVFAGGTVTMKTAAFREHLDPAWDNSADIGRSAQRVRDIYVARNISDGTNSVTPADLKALIDYAKAQGWIS